MKALMAFSVLLLASAGPAHVFAKTVTVWDDTTVIVTVTRTGSPPAASLPPASSPPTSSSALPQRPAKGKNAINAAVFTNRQPSQPPIPASSTSSNPPASPPPPPSSSVVYSPPPQVTPPVQAASATGDIGGNTDTPGRATSSSSQICINFSGNDNFHWLNSGAWGSASGAGIRSASQCFNFAPSAAMFLCENECQGAGDSPDYRYTKLECTFGGDYQNCDISLIDGYSLPLECIIPNAKPVETIGGTTDLNRMSSCVSKGLDNTCKNVNSYGVVASGVSPFFQSAYSDNGNAEGGNYCIFQSCGPKSNIFFEGTPTIECKVGDSGKTALKRGLTSSTEDLEEWEEGSRVHGHRHMHQHAHKSARGLKKVIA